MTSMTSGADYYDHYPTVVLDRPLLLSGLPGVPYREVGHDLAALSGLPLADLDHWVEHQAGQSLWELLQAQGEEILRHMEVRLLEKALKARPCSLVLLGDSALGRPAIREAIQGRAALVYLEVLPATFYWELRRRQRQHGPRAHPFVPFPLENFAQLRPLLEALQPGREQADLVLDVQNRPPQEVVSLLFEALPRLGGASLEGLGDW
jgi:shikimate kinase